MQKLKQAIKAIDVQISTLHPNVDFGSGTTVEENERFDEMLENCHSDQVGKVNSRTHVILYYDYNRDELDELDAQIKDTTKYQKIFNAFDKLYVDGIANAYSKLGYEHIDTTDGSGNGLYYGSILLRKPIEPDFNVKVESKQIIVESEFMYPHEVFSKLNNLLESDDDFKASVLKVMPQDYKSIVEDEQCNLFNYGSPQLYECGWQISYIVEAGSTKLIISNFA